MEICCKFPTFIPVANQPVAHKKHHTVTMGYIYLPASSTQGCVPLPLHSARFCISVIKSLPVWSRKSSKYLEYEVGYESNKY